MNVPPKIRMKPDEFLIWGEAQSEGRFELVDGEVVMMSPERIRHNRAKGEIYIALKNAALKAAMQCEVFTDGIGIQTGPNTIREPDVSVQLAGELDPDAMLLNAPIIVVEVLSPSSERSDTGQKLAEYFSLPSMVHYLIVNPEKRYVIHHFRDARKDIHTRIVSEGSIELTPPGLNVPVERLVGEVGR